MNHRHPPDHPTRLAALVAEEDPRRAFLGSGLAHCPECATTLEELLETAARLDAVGASERAELNGTRSSSDVPGEDRAIAALRAEIAAPPTEIGALQTRNRPPSFWRYALAAAAALVLALAWSRPWEAAPPSPHAPGSGPMLGGSLQALTPVGEVETFGKFEWSGQLPSGGHFTLHVRDAAGETILEVSERTRREWTPAPGDALPDRIQWSVQVFGPHDPGKPLQESPRVESWVSSAASNPAD